MMEKGVRKSGLLATSMTTASVAHPLLTVSSGRTFVLTDLIVTVDPKVISAASAPIIALFDESYSGATAPAQSKAKLKVGLEVRMVGNSASSVLQPLKLHLENGPEFSTAVSVALEKASQKISSGGVYVGGYER